MTATKIDEKTTRKITKNTAVTVPAITPDGLPDCPDTAPFPSSTAGSKDIPSTPVVVCVTGSVVIKKSSNGMILVCSVIVSSVVTVLCGSVVVEILISSTGLVVDDRGVGCGPSEEVTASLVHVFVENPTDHG